MGATSSSTKNFSKERNSTIYSTPPKANNHSGVHNRLVQIQCDPRSPTDGICRTPIQIDGHLPAPPVKLYNNILPHIIGPDIIISDVNNNHNNDDDDDNQENEIRHRTQRLDVGKNDTRRVSGVEPTLDPSEVLTALMANNDGQLPPYQL